MERLAGKRRIIIALVLAAALLFALAPRRTKAESDSTYTLLSRIYNKLGEIINFLNSNSSSGLDDINSKLDTILQNQEAMKEELRIIKLRAGRR